MASDRTNRQINRLLDEAEEAFTEHNWDRVRDTASSALLLDPENRDAINFLAAADRALGGPATPTPSSGITTPTAQTPDQPTFEEALAFCRKAGYRPELAWTCCDYADTLLQRNEPATSALISTRRWSKYCSMANTLGSIRCVCRWADGI